MKNVKYLTLCTLFSIGALASQALPKSRVTRFQNLSDYVDGRNIQNIEISPDGSLVFLEEVGVIYASYSYQMIDLNRKLELQLPYSLSCNRYRPKFSPDGSKLVTACSGDRHGLKIVDLKTMTEVPISFPIDDGVTDIVFTKDSKKMITLGDHGGVVIFDFEKKQATTAIPSSAGCTYQNPLLMPPDESKVVFSQWTNCQGYGISLIHVLDLKTMKEIHVDSDDPNYIQDINPLFKLSLAPDGVHAVRFFKHSIEVFDLSKNQRSSYKNEFEIMDTPLLKVPFSSSQLLTHAADRAQLQVVNLATGQLVGKMISDYPMFRIANSLALQDGHNVLVNSAEGRILMVDTDTLQAIPAPSGVSIPQGGVFAATPDSFRIVMGSSDGALYVWDQAKK